MTSDTARTIADKLVEFCRAHEEAEALATLYHPDAVSVEAAEMGGSGPRETRGIDGIKAKHAWWAANFEVHGGEIEGPFMHGDDRFGVIFSMDATHKESGARSSMKELAVYHIAGGKIVREEFFYTSP